jgi:hypothetical protein
MRDSSRDTFGEREERYLVRFGIIQEGVGG